MEPRFGHDFGKVRLHSGAKAAESADAVNAVAYTVGHDIVLGLENAGSETMRGRRMLAHELVHVVQQGHQSSAPKCRLKINEAGDQFEEEADRIADAVATKGVGQPSLLFEDAADSGTEDQLEAAWDQRILNAGSVSSGAIQRASSLFPKIKSRGQLMLQRTANFVAGAVHAVNNLAQVVLIGGNAGTTWPVLNGRVLHNVDETEAAFAAPVISDVAAGGENTISPGAESACQCQVDSVPSTTGSFDETVLTNGPWTVPTWKGLLADRLKLAECQGKSGPATYTAHGFIDAPLADRLLAAMNREHEDHHGSDIQASCDNIVVPWDAKLTAAQTSQQKFSGANPSACRAALYAAVGGTPEDIAQELAASWQAASDKFHQDPEGREMMDIKHTADAECTHASSYFI